MLEEQILQNRHHYSQQTVVFVDLCVGGFWLQISCFTSFKSTHWWMEYASSPIHYLYLLSVWITLLSKCSLTKHYSTLNSIFDRFRQKTLKFPLSLDKEKRRGLVATIYCIPNTIEVIWPSSILNKRIPLRIILLWITLRVRLVSSSFRPVNTLLVKCTAHKDSWLLRLISPSSCSLQHGRRNYSLTWYPVQVTLPYVFCDSLTNNCSHTDA